MAAPASEYSWGCGYVRRGPISGKGWSACDPHGPHAFLVRLYLLVIDKEMIFIRTMRTIRTKRELEGKEAVG